MTLDNDKLKKKVFLAYLSKGDTVIPGLGGLTLLMGKFFFGLKSVLVPFVGLTALLGAAGIFLTRLILGSSAIENRALEEMREELRREREQSLDNLERRLRGDGDPRTEKFLRDLRVFMEVLKKGDTWTAKINAGSTVDLLIRIEDLFKGCERSLERTLELRETAKKMSTESARKPIEERRDRIVRDVEESLEHLSKVLTQIQGVGETKGEEESQLAKIREEMDECLAVAERVEQRMKSWESPSRVLE